MAMPVLRDALGSPKYRSGAEALILRDLTIRTGVVRSFTKAEYEFRDCLGPVINVLGHRHL